MNKPNIIVIIADDMGPGDMSFYGNKKAETPNLDRLAGEGVRFSNHYSASPMCAPARASFLTGKYPHRTGAIDVSTSRGLDRINPDEPLVSDSLKKLGYNTGMVGKWHNGRDAKGYHPLERGFDEFFGFCLGVSDYWEWTLDDNKKVMKSDGRYITDVFTERALSFIERNREHPYFLYLAYNAPHTPLQAPEEEIIPFREKGGLNEAVCRIYAMIRRMDAGIGRILEAIDDNTIVLFTSDNGPCFRGEGEESRLRYNLGLNGNKGDVLEGGIRVPGILKMPGMREGIEYGSPVHFIDWLPTLYEMAGGDSKDLDGIDGNCIRGITDGTGTGHEGSLFWQWNRLTPVRSCNMAMRNDDLKIYYPPVPEAVRYLESETKPFLEILNGLELRHELNTNEVIRELSNPSEPKLFNLKDDPGELEDISADNKRIQTAMKTKLDEWFERMEKDWRKTAESTLGDAAGIYKREY